MPLLWALECFAQQSNVLNNASLFLLNGWAVKILEQTKIFVPPQNTRHLEKVKRMKKFTDFYEQIETFQFNSYGKTRILSIDLYLHSDKRDA